MSFIFQKANISILTSFRKYHKICYSFLRAIGYVIKRASTHLKYSKITITTPSTNKWQNQLQTSKNQSPNMQVFIETYSFVGNC
jgi:hypothetical protein